MLMQTLKFMYKKQFGITRGQRPGRFTLYTCLSVLCNIWTCRVTEGHYQCKVMQKGQPQGHNATGQICGQIFILGVISNLHFQFQAYRAINNEFTENRSEGQTSRSN